MLLQILDVGTFEELEVYQKARTFRKEISVVTHSFPENEKYRLADQIFRSSRSVTAQIAEGYGRYHYQEGIQFFRIARASLDETHDHLNVALDKSYIKREVYEQLVSKKHTVMRLINGYIKYLERSKRGVS